MAAIPAFPPSPGAAKVPPTSMGNAPSPRETDRPPDPASNQFLQRDRLRKLLQVAKGHHRALILTHDNPDPDAVASACGLAYLLGQCAGLSTTAAYGGIIRRAGNKALPRALHLPILPVCRVKSQPRDLACPVYTRPRAREDPLCPPL